MASLDTPTSEQQADNSLCISDLQTTPGLTDQYDNVLFSICDTTSHSVLTNENATDTDTRFCQHMRRATNADTAYLCNRTTLDIFATSSTDSARQDCSDTQALHSALTSMISDLWNCDAPFVTPDIRVYPDEPQFSFAVLPIDSDRLMILVNTDNTAAVASDYVALAISRIHDLFQTHDKQVPSHARCEALVFDALHSTYQNSSQAVTTRRMELFSQVLKVSRLDFDDSVKTRNSDGRKAIDSAQPLSGNLNQSLYQTAHVWGSDFRLAVDLHFLTEAGYAYKTLCESQNLLQFSASRQLELTLHPGSSEHPEYLQTLEELLEKSVIHASRLQFKFVSEEAYRNPKEQKRNTLATLMGDYGVPSSTAVSMSEQSQYQFHSESQNDSHYNIADEFEIPGSPVNNGQKSKPGKNKKATN